MADKFIRYTDVVDSISSAFSTVMLHLDEFKRPSIAINAVTLLDADDEDITDETDVIEEDGIKYATKYEVVVFGHVDSESE